MTTCLQSFYYRLIIFQEVSILPHVDLNFHMSFAQGVAALHRAYETEDDNEYQEEFKNFIDNFGTHYSRKTVMGGKIVYQMRYTSDEMKSMTVESFRNCTRGRALAILGWKVGLSDFGAVKFCFT